MLKRATFTDMRNSTEEDWKIILEDFRSYAAQLPVRVIAHLNYSMEIPVALR
jgi:hypothetical protein